MTPCYEDRICRIANRSEDLLEEAAPEMANVIESIIALFERELEVDYAYDFFHGVVEYTF